MLKMIFIYIAIGWLVGVSKGCQTDCNRKLDCVDNIDIVYRTIGIDIQSLCYQKDTCFNISGDSTSVPVQQYPLHILHGQNVFFKIQNFSLNKFTLNIYTSSVYNNFETCAVSSPVNYTNVSLDTVSIPRLEVGFHYLVFESNHKFYSCIFGFRLQITVYDNTCGFNSSQQQPCSTKGQCLMNKTSNAYQCQCCSGYYDKFCQELDGCQSNTKPCSGNGVCTDVKNGTYGNTYNCSCNDHFAGDTCSICSAGWSGPNCTKDINECETTAGICNLGECVNTNGSFHCVCPYNVTGTYCEVDFYNSCLSSPCNASNATCIDKDNGFECKCPLDYTGKYCESRINDCSACSPEGTETCDDGHGTYQCNCISGYTGVRCERNIDDCINTCLHGGICVDLLNAFKCHCLPGYDGHLCEDIANKCQHLKPCQNNGTCERAGTNKRDYVCHCIDGFEGQNCTIMINKCESFPCKNNATCNFLFNDYQCDCLSGWTGKNCSTNIDACADEPCKNNATCVDSVRGMEYTCVCPVGFTDRNCSTNMDDCVNVNCTNGVCIDGINSSYCQCNTGWYGKFCNVDQDYCGQTPCLHAVECENVLFPPGFQCTCKSGFTGASCTKNINDCVNHICKNNATCIDGINSYNCSCHPGFEGEFCEIDIDECHPNPCVNNATCYNLLNQYFCSCLPGFSGKTCELDINECDSIPCKNNGTCINQINNFACQCRDGFTGYNCDTHFCDLNTTCLNNGTCLRTKDGSFNCVCLKEFTGMNCELSIDECENASICQNNGTCINLFNGYACQCKYPYNGTHCEQHVCDTGICRNNATCEALAADYNCHCVPGYTGLTCDSDIDECQQNNCSSNGTLKCIDQTNAYQCQCHPAYSGEYCEDHLCDRNNQLCNNGTCIQGKTGYNCLCLPGFQGQHCEININECSNVTCMNTGSCVDGVNNFTCICPHPWTGRYCQETINKCLVDLPCQNNSTCKWWSANATFTCNCTFPYTGRLCSDHICNVSNLCHNGSCIVENDGYTCLCDPGFTGNGCSVDIDECKVNICQNNASCVNTIGGYSCICPSRYTGKQCETTLDYCNSTQCFNGGVCTSDFENQKFKCHCPTQYTGETCESKISICHNQTCSLNGVCVDHRNGSFSCDCFFGFHGPECQYFECPCQSGRCVKPVDSALYVCLCQAGYNGTLCEEFIGDCRTEPRQCSSHTFCQNTDNGYVCVCPSHLQGERCFQVGDCTYDPCQNNGTCSSQTDNKYSCNCTSGYAGEQCQYDLNECLSSPCLNQGKCVEDIVGAFRCRCSVGFYGENCQYSYKNLTSSANWQSYSSSSSDWLSHASSSSDWLSRSFITTKYSDIKPTVSTINQGTSLESTSQKSLLTTGNILQTSSLMASTVAIQTSILGSEPSTMAASKHLTTSSASFANNTPALTTLQKVTTSEAQKGSSSSSASSVAATIRTVYSASIQPSSTINMEKSSRALISGVISPSFTQPSLKSTRTEKLVSSAKTPLSSPTMSHVRSNNSQSMHVESNSSVVGVSCSTIGTQSNSIAYTTHIKPNVTTSKSLVTHVERTLMTSFEYTLSTKQTLNSTTHLESSSGQWLSAYSTITPIHSTTFTSLATTSRGYSTREMHNSAEVTDTISHVGRESVSTHAYTSQMAHSNIPNLNSTLTKQTELLPATVTGGLNSKETSYTQFIQSLSSPIQTMVTQTSPIFSVSPTISNSHQIKSTVAGKSRNFTSIVSTQNSSYSQPIESTVTGDSKAFSSATVTSKTVNSERVDSTASGLRQASSSAIGIPHTLNSQQISTTVSSNSQVIPNTTSGILNTLKITSTTIGSSPKIIHSTQTGSSIAGVASISSSVALTKSPAQTSTTSTLSTKLYFQSTNIMQSLNTTTTSISSVSMSDYSSFSNSRTSLNSLVLSETTKTNTTMVFTPSTSSSHLKTMSSLGGTVSSAYGNSIPSMSLETSSNASISSEIPRTSIAPTSSSISDSSSISPPSPPTTTTPRPYINLTCADDPCNGYPCINESDNGLSFRCQCPFGTASPRCSSVQVIHYPRFNGFSYLEIPPVSLDASNDTITLLFHTTKLNGLLMYAFHEQYSDHVEVYIQNGRLVVSLDTGDKITKVTSSSRVDTGGEIASILRLDTQSKMVTLTVNQNEIISSYIASSLKSVQVTSPWYIGGTPDYVNSKSSVPSFTGCIKELVINGVPQRLADPNYARNWTNIGECDISLCKRHVCQNNATCTPDHTNLNDYQCQCQSGYHGRTCDKKITDHCSGDVCNGGMCVWTVNGRKCLCQYGRVGENCLTDTVIFAPLFSTFLNYSSFMEYPWLQTGRFAKERLELRFQFRVENSSTSLVNSLLMYTGQSTVGAPMDDFFSIGIIDRHLHVIFNLGGGMTVLRSKQPLDLIRNWHFVVAGRTAQQGYMYVDSQEKVEGSAPGWHSSLDVFTPLYIGGFPDFRHLPAPLRSYFHRGFDGLIADMAFRTKSIAYTPLLTVTESTPNMVGVPVENGLNIINDGQDYCNDSNNTCANNGKCTNTGTGFTCECVQPFKGITCQDKDILCVDYNPCSAGSTCQSNGFSVQCDCPLGKQGEFCEEGMNITIPYFTQNSYLSLAPPTKVNIRSVFILDMRFKSDAAYGLLFYTSHSLDGSASGDFLSISIWRRYIYVKYNLGTHTASMRSRGKITIQRWHSLYIRRENKDAVMRLDGNYFIGVRASGSMTKLDVSINYFLGGVPLLSGINREALKDVQSQRDFTGCINHLKVNGYTFNLASTNPSLNGRNIGECGGACLQNQCGNGAQCLSNSTSYSCLCNIGRNGALCDNDLNNLTSARFSSSSYWFTRRSDFSTNYYSHLQLDFKSRAADGLIFWNGRLRDANSDWLGIGLWGGKLKVSFGMDKNVVTGFSTFSYNDGMLHKFILTRIGNTLQFIVNGHTPQMIQNSKIKEFMETEGHIYLGGLPGNVSSLTGNQFKNGFDGCLSGVILNQNGRNLDFASTIDSLGSGIDVC